MLKIATWNVNSVKARGERLLSFLARESPDVLCLQELKIEAEAFPHAQVQAAGYHALLHAQKTYNGVAILARSELIDGSSGFDDGVDDPQARHVEASVAGLRVLCLYAPNGGERSSDKFVYKRRWFARLLEHLARKHAPQHPLLLCGDLNVAPDDLDVARPDEWRESVLCATEVREAFAQLINWGLVDVVRKHHPAGGPLSWWDYRMLSFPKGNGLRIDHILATAPVSATSVAATVDRDERKGKQPSDHAPVIATFDWPQ
jgi:exodeoxyribonuclease-3